LILDWYAVAESNEFEGLNIKIGTDRLLEA